MSAAPIPSPFQKSNARHAALPPGVESPWRLQQKAWARRQRNAAIASGEWPASALYWPLPEQCSSVQDGHSDREQSLYEYLGKIGENSDPKKWPEGITANHIGKDHYLIRASYTALATAFKCGRRSIIRYMSGLTDKRSVGVFVVDGVEQKGKPDHSATVWEVRPYTKILEARRAGGPYRGDGAHPQTRLAVDGQRKVWCNGRRNSRRLLSEFEFAEWRLGELVGAGEGSSAPTAAAAAVTQFPQASEGGTAPPAGVIEVPDVFLDELRRHMPMPSDIDGAIYAAFAELPAMGDKLTVLAETCKRCQAQTKDAGYTPPYLITAITRAIPPFLAERARNEKKWAAAELKQLREQIFSTLEMRAKGDDQTKFEAQAWLNDTRKFHGALVDECEGLYKAQKASAGLTGTRTFSDFDVGGNDP